jgi:hypothetical protein
MATERRLERLETASPPDVDIELLSDDELVALMFDPRDERFAKALAALSGGALSDLDALMDADLASLSREDLE